MLLISIISKFITLVLLCLCLYIDQPSLAPFYLLLFKGVFCDWASMDGDAVFCIGA